MRITRLWSGGSEWDREAVVGSIREFAPRLPDARLDIITEAGHAPWLDELELCAQRTREFLAA